MGRVALRRRDPILFIGLAFFFREVLLPGPLSLPRRSRRARPSARETRALELAVARPLRRVRAAGLCSRAGNLADDIRSTPMKALDQLTDSEIRALGQFITGCLRIRGTSHWRTRFAECAARGRFVPYVNLADETHLQDLIDRHGESVVCGVRTREVISERTENKGARQDIPVVFPMAKSLRRTT